MKLFIGIGSTAILLLLAGCSSSEEPASGNSTEASKQSIASDSGVTLASNRAAKVLPSENVDAAGAMRQRQVVRNASMKVRVPSVEDAERRVIKALSAWGGYVESSASTNLASEKPTLDMTLRLPVARFDEGLKFFGDLGVTNEKAITGEDVTAKVVDLDARVATMKATEDSIRQLLRSAHGLDEITSLRERLGSMRADIESLMAQRKALGELASLATVRLSLEQNVTIGTAKSDPGWAQESWASSTNGVMGLLRGAGSFGIMAIVYVPVWGPLAFVAWYVAKHRRRKLAQAQRVGLEAPLHP